MTLTTKQILEAHEGLLFICNESVKLPAQVAWNLYANIDAMETIVSRFDSQREKLLSPLQQKEAFFKAEDGSWMCKSEFAEEYTNVVSKIEEYLKIENEITITKIPLSEFSIPMSLAEMRILNFMFVQDNSKE